MKIVIIDNEIAIRETLKTLISLYMPSVHVVAEADGVNKGIEVIRANKPDLVLLDIEMDDGSGFDLLSIYGEVDFKVIFVTAHNGYAIKAFKYSALDYVLKPVDLDDLISAISKADQQGKDENRLKINSFFHNNNSSLQEKKIVLKDAVNIYLITLSEIIRCQSENNYTRFFLTEGRKIMVTTTLKEYESMFQDALFFRTHQSHLINLQHFEKFVKTEGGSVHMKDGSVLPVSLRKKDLLIAALEKM